MPGHRKRRQFKQTDAFTRGMVIGLKRAGWSIRQIAADTHLGAYTVHRLWRRWLEQGNVAIYRNVGATRVTSARVDRRILRHAVAAPQATCTAILQHVQATLDHSISTRTISRRLVANGLHSCRPLRRLPLTPPNRRQRLEWCRARSMWMTEWHRVVFSDESRFCLSSDSRRVRVWRRRGERSNPAAIVERPTVRQRGIMVWGAIAYDSRSPLLRIQGTMTAQRYVDDVLRPVTLPYLQGVPNALYQQDNARPHTARISQQALQDVQMLPWPPYSPDLSPIEHVWDIIGRRLHALPQPRSEDELWQMVEREWRAIPQDAIRTLIDSLPRRVAACIAVRGTGFDEIMNEAIKVLPKEYCISLMDIFNRILKTYEFPTTWLKSVIQPIFKNGDQENPSDYRAIALLSNIAKLFTSILKSLLGSWIERREIVPENQAEFRGGIELNPGPKRQTTLTPAISQATHESADSDLKVLILNLSTEMKSMRERLDSGLAQIERRLEEWDKRAQEIETKIIQSMEAQRNTDKRVASNTLQLHELEARIEYTEARLREQNLIFYGIVREENENLIDCNRKVKSIITDKMGLTDEVKITKCHRLSRAENSPVLAVIPDHEERARVLSNAIKLKGSKYLSVKTIASK
ncbi:hypothetical protein LAZ67_5003020 [Cordylochernes scorpioides]|uniref:Transposase n=1 Tax=Cordylochernes scorpioides TaxID=51811 RepID=A0ABY6KGY7_9ARAC|nr:hypothetical protein LAZ67_5003020 [Cordylochernes scorpioides]